MCLHPGVRRLGVINLSVHVMSGRLSSSFKGNAFDSSISVTFS